MERKRTSETEFHFVYNELKLFCIYANMHHSIFASKSSLLILNVLVIVHLSKNNVLDLLVFGRKYYFSFKVN